MFQMAVSVLLELTYPEALALQQELVDHRIYLFKDASNILYIGQSKVIIHRVRGHLGLGTKDYKSPVGRLIWANSPASHQWQIIFFTQQECLDLLPAHAFFRLEQQYSSWSLSSYLQKKDLTLSLHKVERFMIQHHKTCLNIDSNPSRTPLPLTYQLPPNELPEGLLCTSHPETCAYQVSYKAYEWKSHQKHDYVVIMYAHFFWECRNKVMELLGFLPEKLHVAPCQDAGLVHPASEEYSDEEDWLREEGVFGLESLWWCADCDTLHSERVCPKLQAPNEQREAEEMQESEHLVIGEEEETQELPLFERRKLLQLTPEILRSLSPYATVMTSWEATTDGYPLDRASDAWNENRFQIQVVIWQRGGGTRWHVQWWITALDELQPPRFDLQVISNIRILLEFLIDLQVPQTCWIYQHAWPSYAHTLWEPF